MVPGLTWLLEVLLLLLLNKVKTSGQVSVGQDIVVAGNLFFSVLVADSAKGHAISAVLLSETFLSDLDLDLLADFVPLLFVFVTNVFINQALLIFNLHVNWIVHKAIILNCDGQLFAVVLTVSHGLVNSFVNEFVFLCLVVELATNGVEVIAFPV